MNIRRISILGSPGCRKSTTAAEIFSYLKRQDIKIELIGEQFKSLIYYGVNTLNPHYQLKILADQMSLEMLYLDKGADLIVTDCPIILNVFYAKQLGVPYWKELLEMERQYNKEFPSTNIFLPYKRDSHTTVGRLHNKEQSIQIERDLMAFLYETETNFTLVNGNVMDCISQLLSN